MTGQSLSLPMTSPTRGWPWLPGWLLWVLWPGWLACASLIR